MCQKTVAVGQKCQEPIAELVQIEEASSKISDLLEVVLSYVDKVLASSDCNAADNSHIGRILLDLMHSVPHVSPERFEEMFNSNVKVKCFLFCCQNITIMYIFFFSGLIDGYYFISTDKDAIRTERKTYIT